jgi:CheY-like chemotaxis protein
MIGSPRSGAIILSAPSVISVIDDDPSVRLATNNLLTSRGYAVSIFGSAREYLQSAELKTTSCVIADVRMSAMSGVDLLVHIRGLGHHTPFIFVTAFPDDAAVRERAEGRRHLLSREAVFDAGSDSLSGDRSVRVRCSHEIVGRQHSGESG